MVELVYDHYIWIKDHSRPLWKHDEYRAVSVFWDMGKHKGSMITCKFHEWESSSDSDVAEEWALSKLSHKQWKHKITIPEITSRGMIPFPDSNPTKLGLSVELPIPGLLLSILSPSQWGREDPTTSITGKLPHPLGKSKGWTAAMTPSVWCDGSSILKCVADCKSDPGPRTYPRTACDNWLHD